MIKLLLIAVSASIFISCTQERETIETTKEVFIEQQIEPIDDFDYENMEGIYRGDFGDGTISIILNYVSESNAIGYNIHRGMQRNLNGKVDRVNNTLIITLSEPGDHKYDGVFELNIRPNQKEIDSKWVCNDSKISTKVFKLKKREERKENKNGEYKPSLSNVEFLSDNTGDYQFRDDGMLIFKYYPSHDEENRIEQFKEIKGNWVQNDKTVIIEWENNTLFQDKKEEFEIHDSGDYDFRLENESRTIEPMYPY